MDNPITIVVNNIKDVPSEELYERLAAIGFDGVELTCGPNERLDAQKCAQDQDYCHAQRATLEKFGLGCRTLGNHTYVQNVLSEIKDSCWDVFSGPPKSLSDEGEQIYKRYAEEIKDMARAAKAMGASCVTAFTYPFQWSYTSAYCPFWREWADFDLRIFKEHWLPILDFYQELGIKFALEVGEIEIAYDVPSTDRLLEELDYHPALAFNYDWFAKGGMRRINFNKKEDVDFIRKFSDRILNVHEFAYMGFLGPRTSLRNADALETNLTALNNVGYQGPVSVEWIEADELKERQTDRWDGIQNAYNTVKGIMSKLAQKDSPTSKPASGTNEPTSGVKPNKDDPSKDGGEDRERFTFVKSLAATISVGSSYFKQSNRTERAN